MEKNCIRLGNASYVNHWILPKKWSSLDDQTSQILTIIVEKNTFFPRNVHCISGYLTFVYVSLCVFRLCVS